MIRNSSSRAHLKHTRGTLRVLNALVVMFVFVAVLAVVLAGWSVLYSTRLNDALGSKPTSGSFPLALTLTGEGRDEIESATIAVVVSRGTFRHEVSGTPADVTALLVFVAYRYSTITVTDDTAASWMFSVAPDDSILDARPLMSEELNQPAFEVDDATDPLWLYPAIGVEFPSQLRSDSTVGPGLRERVVGILLYLDPPITRTWATAEPVEVVETWEIQWNPMEPLPSDTTNWSAGVILCDACAVEAVYPESAFEQWPEYDARPLLVNSQERIPFDVKSTNRPWFESMTLWLAGVVPGLLVTSVVSLLTGFGGSLIARRKATIRSLAGE